MNNTIVIINYGSQYTQLIARRIRELGVYTEVIGHKNAKEYIQKNQPQGVIFSGGPASVYEKNSPSIYKEIFDAQIPILGICYGMQLMGTLLGGKIHAGKSKEFGKSDLRISSKKSSLLLEKIPLQSTIWASHGDELNVVPKDFSVLAKSNYEKCIAVIEHNTKPFYGVQFHPEVTHTEHGSQLLHNFVFSICKCKKTWQTKTQITNAVNQIKDKVKNQKVVLGLSGGVDSSVAAVLIHQAIGKNLTCIFVDTGLMRLNEGKKVMDVYAKNLQLNILHIDASKIFLTALKNVEDPEEKRKIIGKKFVEVFQREAKKIKGVKFLAQGTIYPDVIESSTEGGNSHTIKSHHNVGGLPKTLNLELLEPLRNLFKDEVRNMGKALGIPAIMIDRHPFPGPGLGIRIIGAITKEKIKILQEADAIFIEALEKEKLYNTVSQAFVALLPVRSVGVMGDQRTYAYTAVIRAVNTIDFMTATWSKLPYEFLEQVSHAICNQVQGINHVVYDISSKPPSTIEWE